MKVYERVLLMVYPLTWVGVALVVVMVAAGWNVPLDNLQKALATTVNRWGLGAGAAVLLIVALKLFLDNFRQQAVVQALVRQNPIGEVRITLPALENLVVRGAHRVTGVRDVRPRVRITPDGVAVFVQASVTPESEIPEVSSELQRAIKESLERTAGIEVLEARVLVDGIGHESKGRVE